MAGWGKMGIEDHQVRIRRRDLVGSWDADRGFAECGQAGIQADAPRPLGTPSLPTPRLCGSPSLAVCSSSYRNRLY